jgi:chemotaxis protein MotB
MVNDEKNIIIIRRKGAPATSHNGAWKVAYADFITALMALFIVLWLMNTSKPVQEAIGGYFRDPNGTGKKTGTQFSKGTGPVALSKEDMNKLKQELMKALGGMPNFDKLKDLIVMTVTPEGLKIELMESPNGTFFENGSAQPSQVLRSILKILAPELGKLPNPILIEGHTDSRPYADAETYGNWELSTDRANTARRLMENSGVHPEQIVQVRGFADRELRDPQHPQNSSNRRVTIIIQYSSTMNQAVIVSNGNLSHGGNGAPVSPAGQKPVTAAKRL